MKKIILLITFITLAFCGFSQNATVDQTLDYDQTYVWYDGVATDVITTTDTTWTYTVRKKTDALNYCFVDMLIDSTGGTANSIKIYLQNKKFPDTDFTTITTVTWDGTNVIATGKIVNFAPSAEYATFNSDSTITTTVSDQNNAGEYWRVYVEGQDNTILASIRRLNFKFVK